MNTFYICLYILCVMYRQQLCNQRQFFSHNVEMNNTGILFIIQPTGQGSQAVCSRTSLVSPFPREEGQSQTLIPRDRGGRSPLQPINVTHVVIYDIRSVYNI